MKESFISQKKLLIMVSVIFIALCVVWIFDNCKTSQDISPERFAEILQDAGYEIFDVHRTEDDHPGPMELPQYGIRFSLVNKGNTYSVLVAQYNDCRQARRSAKQINNLDDRMNGGYAYSIHYGKLLVQLFPSEKELGQELLSLCKRK